MRAVILAPIARNLVQEYPRQPIVKLEGVTNGTLQAWDTMAGKLALRLARIDATIAVHTARHTLPVWALFRMILVLRSNIRTAWVNPHHKLLQDCGAADFFRVRSDEGADFQVKRKSELVAGDWPMDWQPAHSWAGEWDASQNTDRLGEP